MENKNEERFIFKAVHCKSCGEFGFKIVDLETRIESEGTMHIKKDINPTLPNFLKKVKEKVELDEEPTVTALIRLAENLHKLPIPDLAIEKDETTIDFLQQKEMFARAQRQGLLRVYRMRMWLKEDRKPFIFIPESFKGAGDWIDLFIIPDDPEKVQKMPYILNPNQLYSKQQAREYIEKNHQKGWIDDFERATLLSEVNNLENFPEQTSEEIERDQAKHN